MERCERRQKCSKNRKKEKKRDFDDDYAVNLKEKHRVKSYCKIQDN